MTEPTHEPYPDSPEGVDGQDDGGDIDPDFEGDDHTDPDLADESDALDDGDHE